MQFRVCSSIDWKANDLKNATCDKAGLHIIRHEFNVINHVLHIIKHKTEVFQNHEMRNLV